jgi:hypothetical protein
VAEASFPDSLDPAATRAAPAPVEEASRFVGFATPGNLGFFPLSVPGVLKVLDRTRTETRRHLALQMRPGNTAGNVFHAMDIPVDHVGSGVVQYHCNSSAMFRGG